MRLLRGILLPVLIVVVCSGISGQTADVITKINKALQAADATLLSNYFNSTIDLEIDETDGNFSKKQAEIILRDFFNKSPVASYSPNHQGESNDGSKYIIGTYKSTSNVEYRVYILLKNDNDLLLINQLQFEAD